jgi:hypothetical protein
MADEELVRVGASAPRRLIGVTAIGGLGALLLYIAFATPPAAPGWLAFMVAMGFFSLWGAVRVWVATSHELILTEEALMDSDGTVLARFDEIEKVDRSMFAMKPSNGFLVLLKEPRPRAWRPGLWWRIGRGVAVGGVTAGSQTRPVADIINLRLAQARGEL